MTFEIREALPHEYDEAGEVTALAYREHAREGEADWERYLDRLRDVRSRASVARVLVVVEEGRVLGTATLELTGRIDEEHDPLAADEAHLRMLAVHPEARRRGVAKALMAACDDASRGAGKSRLTLNTTERMKAAQTMYESLGFARMPDRVFPDGFVLLSYEKRL